MALNTDTVARQIETINEQMTEANDLLGGISTHLSDDGQEWSFKDKRRVQPYQKPNTTTENMDSTAENESTPLRADPVAEAAARIARTLATTIEASLRQQPRQPNYPLPEYHGHDFEDPREFARKLNRHFAQANITDEYEKVAIANKQLKGDAARWYSLYRDLPLDYASFLQRLNNKFNTTSVLAAARSKLYGEAQEDQEPVSLFVTRKMTLFSRLDPLIPEGMMVDTIVEQLLPEIRSRLRAYTCHDAEDLITVATQIESDLKIINKTARVPPRGPRLDQAQAANNAERPRFQNTCRRCNHAHLFVDCPLRRQENSQRVGRPAEIQRGPERPAPTQ